MLPCVCSVIDHSWRQNVIRTSGTRGDSRLCHWCSYHILTSSVIDLLNRRTATWNLFVLYNNKTHNFSFFFKIFLNYSKAGLCPVWQTRKKVIWRNLCLYKMKQSHWLLCRNKELWLVNKNHATVKLDSNGFSWKGLTAKVELNCEIYNC